MHKTETKSIILTIFLIGIISCVYYLISVLSREMDPVDVIEKTMLVGIIIAILIILAVVLYKQIELIDWVDTVKEYGILKPAAKRSAKDVKKDMMRAYRDMGALKIVLKDRIIEPETYNREKKELDEKIETLKREYKKLTK